MMRIGKTYVERKDDRSYLCADIAIDEHRTTLWFAIERSQEDYLCIGQADPFVMALLPSAMRGNHDIICEESMSERLYYQLEAHLIPALSFAGEIYHSIKIKAPLTAENCRNAGAIGTGFSGGVDCLYTIMCHPKKSGYPLTHIAVFNAGVYEGKDYRESFAQSCGQAERFAKEQSLKTVFLDANLQEVLPERFLDVCSFRNLSCALALQGLFSIYLFSSGRDATNFTFNLRNSSAFDLLTVNCASTETVSFYLSGVEIKRVEKLRLLAEWEPSWKWLHPCFHSILGEKNCGCCQKCIRDLTTLYALGKLDRYRMVFDIKEYQKYFSQRLAVLLANRGNCLYDEAVELLKKHDIEIPETAYLYEEQFRKSMKNLERTKTD